MKLWDDELEAYREQARSLLQFLPDPSSGETPADPVERAEAMRHGLVAMLDGERSSHARVWDVPGPAGDVPVRVFEPDGRARALFLHIHGGGWIAGDPSMTDVLLERRARELGLAVVSVDYRLAPEHPYPAGPDDCEAAARWLLEKGPSEFGAERMFIGGESAGGHLAAVTGLRVRDRLRASDRLLGLELVFGIYDVNGTPSWRGNGGQPDMLDTESLGFMVECFTPGMSPAERRDPDVSPLYADLSGLPPCLVSVGSLDHLRDDSLFLAARLAAAGVDTQLEVYPDSPHGFQAMPGPMTEAWSRRTHAWLERVLGASAA